MSSIFLPPTIDSLSTLTHIQPPELLRHSRAVSHLAQDLAQVAGGSNLEQERVCMGGLLHDIGKQFIPNAILEKKEKLTTAEYERIQLHPWTGYAYLYNFVSDPIILNTVLYHHERWNGTGYPYRLKGEQIPLSARICALADVWDALVSERCYRSAWCLTHAMDLIWASPGSLFDPELAYQFLTMIDTQYAHVETSESAVIAEVKSKHLSLENMNSRTSLP